MQLNEELYTNLMDVALVAARHGYLDKADGILDCLNEQSPKDVRAQIAKGIARIYLDRAPEAVSILRDEVLKVRPDHPFARGFLGFALKMTGRKSEGNGVLRNLIAEAPNPTAIEFAESLLDDPAFDEIEPAEEDLDSELEAFGQMMQPIIFA